VTSERIIMHLKYKQEKRSACKFRSLTSLLWIPGINLRKSVHLCVCSPHLTVRVETVFRVLQFL